jgi:actin-related protein
VVIELGSRYLRAGLAGDSMPKAVIGFGPDEQRRAGDLRKWEVDYSKNWRQRIRGSDWGEEYELWKLDLRDVDLGLVGDRIERAVREAYTKLVTGQYSIAKSMTDGLYRYLLIDSRPRRMALALSSSLPLPLLSTVLDSLFTHFHAPNISLISAPLLTTVAAGLRSALVVDIGWAETVVTGIYEYREVQCKRSVRASKLLGIEMFKMLNQAVNATIWEDEPGSTNISRESRETVSFEECEEVVARVAYCKSAQKVESHAAPQALTPVKEEDEFRSSMRSLNVSEGPESDPKISIPLSSTTPPKTVEFPFSTLAEPCEAALFATSKPLHDFDDEELPLHLLVYQSLLQLPIDVRSFCMARIIFVGGGSRLLGLKERILDEVTNIVEQRGWDPVSGKAVEKFRNNPNLQRRKQAASGPTEVSGTKEESTPKVDAAILEQERDPIEEKLKREASKGLNPLDYGYVRSVESLGAWSGCSLLSQLKVPSVSIVDREQWLQHGAAGATRISESGVGSQRQSIGPVAFNKTGGADRSSWTLGLWG